MKNQSYQAYRKNINKSHELKHEIGKYLKYWPLMLGFLIISVSIVFVKLRYTKKEYQSNAKIKILSNSKGLEYKRFDISLLKTVVAHIMIGAKCLVL